MYLFRALRPFLLIFLCATVAFAGAASDFLREKQATLRAVIEQPQSPATDAALKAKFDALLDYETLAKSSLADEWEKLTAEQRQEFTGLLQTLVQRAYTKSIRDTLDYTITFKGEAAGQAGELVQTVAQHKTDKRKESIAIDYLLRKAAAGYLVIDIVTEGSSLVDNYRNQFKRVIAKKGYPGLIEKMKAKAAEK